MKCVITVFGKDKVGIIAKTCAYLSEVNINILDISKISKPMEIAAEELKGIGKELGVIVSMQHEDIFNCMHRI